MHKRIFTLLLTLILILPVAGLPEDSFSRFDIHNLSYLAPKGWEHEESGDLFKFVRWHFADKTSHVAGGFFYVVSIRFPFMKDDMAKPKRAYWMLHEVWDGMSLHPSVQNVTGEETTVNGMYAIKGYVDAPFGGQACTMATYCIVVEDCIVTFSIINPDIPIQEVDTLLESIVNSVQVS